MVKKKKSAHQHPIQEKFKMPSSHVDHKKLAELDKDYEIAYDFATKCYQKFQQVIKAISLFGSVAKSTITEKSDIDLIVIIDDCTIAWDSELIEWYRVELAKLIAAQSYKDKLHVNTVTLTSFWEEVKAGEPVAINVLRYGQPLIDFGGFFDPLKILLAKGRIRPSPEAVFTTLKRSLGHYYTGIGSVLHAVEEYYWAVIDAAHAALMAEGEVPPSPEHVAQYLEEVFVKTKKIDKRYVQWYEEIRQVSKKIAHREMRDIQGKQLDDIKKKAELFVRKFKHLTELLIKHQKILKVEERKRN